MWSAYLLPFIDQQVLYKTLDLNGPWRPTLDATDQNVVAQNVWLDYMRCPSANVADSQYDDTANLDRTPSCYLACSSGLLAFEAGDFPWAGMDAFGGFQRSDGIFFANSKTTMAAISDGTSTTVLLGESLPDQDLLGEDRAGNLQKVDHWYIGSDELTDMASLGSRDSSESSECLGSTACPINSLLQGDATTIDEKELSFGSRHTQGTNIGFADGHVQFVSDSIGATVWSAVGTRSGNEVVSTFD